MQGVKVMKMFRLGAVIVLSTAAVTFADLALTDRVVTTPGHIFTIDDTGLPAQLDIRAATNDIPLPWRRAKEWPAVLVRRIGRGPQLAAPVRIEAVMDALTVPAKTDAPAILKKTGKGVEASAGWKAGTLNGRLSLLYGEDGSISGQITFPGAPTLELLELVLTLSGPVDTAIAGKPAVAGKSLPEAYGSLKSEPGMLWRNGAEPTGDGAGHPGHVQHFFLGNGDRGFSWLAHGNDGLAIDRKSPSIRVERSREGFTVWRIALLNTKAPAAGERTVGFTLLTHPSRPRTADRRITQWQPWPQNAPVASLAAAARGKVTGDIVRADAATVHEANIKRALLAGSAGGDAISAAATLADRFPIALFRYLSATHTALAAQLRPNAAQITTSGAEPSLDRMALGRALLHDIGVDVNALADRIEAAATLSALETFGLFKAAHNTEFLPYWRAHGIVTFGSPISTDARDDPAARTRVSTYIRRRQALFVIVNESDVPVRGQLQVLQPYYLFGGPNRLTIKSIYGRLDFSHIPSNSDWAREEVITAEGEGDPLSSSMADSRSGGSSAALGMPAEKLMDVETGGYVRKEKTRKRRDRDKNAVLPETYGPIYVPARGMRLLYGMGGH
ncbi:MAG: hypothetical protein QGH42_11860 [Kiritimatiellia bacterium]|jgi:hypothetical protein|nr:hypothetical protein [Kiritimatiellia bacterium]MDP6811376.1 hypothetical protein [Kiritimatiellia bacterium]MDP7024920.1 hypothetical protein [Kiritimatiellia bacterium]